MTTFLSFIHGTLIHSLSINKIEYINDGLIGFDNMGIIRIVERNVTSDSQLEDIVTREGGKLADVIRLNKHQFVMPGFIDTHAHAPQYTFTGNGQDLPLLEWLNTYTFPREAAFSSPEYARKAYDAVISRFLKNGTTTCAYYGTIHLEACKVLVDIIAERGQRAFVGKVNMDCHSPDYYIETTNDSLSSTVEFISYVLSKDNPLVTPVVTPRFVPTCSGELLKGLGALAEKYDLPIQSHLSENHAEIARVKELFPDVPDYTSVYDKYDLLTPRTVMAHCCHLSAEERKILKERGVGISHCPTSNFALYSGILDVRKLLEEGQKVGLGTDVSGGYAPSMLDAIRSTMFASKVCKINAAEKGNGAEYKVLSLPEVVYLATIGGATLMNLEDRVGNFTIGKVFDALLVDPKDEGISFDLFDHDDVETMFEKFLYLGDDRAIKEVFIGGKKVVK